MEKTLKEEIIALKEEIKVFKEEFKIHFKDSPDELRFLEVFIDDLLQVQRKEIIEIIERVESRTIDEKYGVGQKEEQARSQLRIDLINKLTKTPTQRSGELLNLNKTYMITFKNQETGAEEKEEGTEVEEAEKEETENPPQDNDE